MSQLQRRVENASPAALSALRAEVVAMVAATQISVQQAQNFAQPGDALQIASSAARTAVTDFTHNFYEKKLFEPYLHFASREEEDAYRKRELETKRAIEDALKQNTPERNLRAAELSMTQLKDAGVHGADKSPEFAQEYRKLHQVEANLGHVVQETKPMAATAAPAVDPLDSVKSVAVDPAILTSLKAAQVSVADQTQGGHGVTLASPPTAGLRIG